MPFNIVVRVRGADQLPSRLRRIRIGIIARVTRMLELIGQAVTSKSTETYLSGPRPERLGRRSGDLARSIAYRIVGNKVTVGTNLPYGRIHEYGGVIVPRRARRLIFRLLDGSWRSALRVVIPDRPYLRPALSDSRTEARGIITRLSEEAIAEAMA